MANGGFLGIGSEYFMVSVDSVCDSGTELTAWPELLGIRD